MYVIGVSGIYLLFMCDLYHSSITVYYGVKWCIMKYNLCLYLQATLKWFFRYTSELKLYYILCMHVVRLSVIIFSINFWCYRIADRSFWLQFLLKKSFMSNTTVIDVISINYMNFYLFIFYVSNQLSYIKYYFTTKAVICYIIRWFSKYMFTWNEHSKLYVFNGFCLNFLV